MDNKTDEILVAARSWLGTKFHHQGRKKDVGVDCIGLVVGVAAELGLHENITVHDRQNYARQPDESELQNALVANFREVELQVGAVALFNIDGRAQHVGIITDYADLGVIHAYAQARKVVEHGLDAQWRKRIIATYAFA